MKTILSEFCCILNCDESIFFSKKLLNIIVCKKINDWFWGICILFDHKLNVLVLILHYYPKNVIS